MSGGAPAVVAVSEGIEELAFAGGTVRRLFQQLAMRRIMVSGGRRHSKTAEVFGTDMAAGKTNGSQRTETSVRDLHAGLSACLSACWLVGLWACWLVGLWVFVA